MNRVQAAPISHTFLIIALAILDLLIIVLSGMAAYFFYVHLVLGLAPLPYFAIALVGGSLAVFLFRQFGVYEDKKLFSATPPFAKIIFAWLLTLGLLLLIAFAFKITANFSRVWSVSWFAITPFVLFAVRFPVSRWLRRLARRGHFASRTVIIGTGVQARKLAQHLILQKDQFFEIVGIVEDTPKEDWDSELLGLGFDKIGTLPDLVSKIRAGKIDEVFIALPWTQEQEIQSIIAQLAQTPVIIRLAPDLISYQFTDRPFSSVADLPMLNIFDRPISGWHQLLKTAEDHVLALFFLSLLSPLMIMIAIAIKLESPGSVLFKQTRYGFNHNLITVWKFRSMHLAASDQGGGTQAKKEDSRVTKVGLFIRKASLDELPQLFNVLGGTMSLVGPRPHPVETRAAGRLFEDVVDNYAARHRVKPGITGWAQVNGWRGETDTEEKIRQRVEHDLYYIDNWSIWLDLWIILRTVLVIFRDKNAY